MVGTHGPCVRRPGEGNQLTINKKRPLVGPRLAVVALSPDFTWFRDLSENPEVSEISDFSY
jgi:hypothetical protein